MVKEALGEEVTAAELGGIKVHEHNGVAHFVSDTDLDAALLARDLLSYLPSHRDLPLPLVAERSAGAADPAVYVPADPRKVYDVRSVISGIADGGEMLEVASGWARNLVTGFIRIEGRPVGVVANQPRYLGGVLDTSSSEKGARFVSQCDAFGVPLLVLVDTPGFMPGTHQRRPG